jgi:hypothetical protein
LGIAVGIVASVNFYPEHQHQLLDLPWQSLLSLPGLIDLENFLCKSRGEPDVFQTQDYLIVNPSREDIDRSAG